MRCAPAFWAPSTEGMRRQATLLGPSTYGTSRRQLVHHIPSAHKRFRGTAKRWTREKVTIGLPGKSCLALKCRFTCRTLGGIRKATPPIHKANVPRVPIVTSRHLAPLTTGALVWPAASITIAIGFERVGVACFKVRSARVVSLFVGLKPTSMCNSRAGIRNKGKQQS